nr:methyl-accepting chemotaxis protein [uncultured Anaeromusa sp.]
MPQPQFSLFSRFRTSLSWKVAAVTAVLFAIAITVIISISTYYDVQETRQTILQNMTLQAQLVSQEISLETSRSLTTLETSAFDEIWQSENLDVLQNRLKRLRDSQPTIDNVFLVEKNGQRLNADGQWADLSNREYVQKAFRTKKSVFSEEVLASSYSGKLSLMMITPISVAGKERYLGTAVGVQGLQSIVTTKKYGQSGYAFAIDKKTGLVFAHPNQDFVGKLRLLDAADSFSQGKIPPELAVLATASLTGETGSRFYRFEDKEIVAGYAPIPGTPYATIVRMEVAEALAPIQAKILQNALLGLLSIALAAITIFWLIRRQLQPVSTMVLLAQQMAAGDFSQHLEETTANKDEIGSLQTAFAQMIHAVKKLLAQTSEAAEQISAASQQLNASSEESARDAIAVANQTTQVAEDAERQLEAVEAAEHAAGQISSYMHRITQQTEHMSSQTSEASEAATDGSRSVQASIQQMKDISVANEQASEAIQKLGTTAEQIGSISSIIKQLASQTNLLALNAAIEAARAGEQGRGFAVVAEEVRHLAEQSATAADEIAKNIQEVQKESRLAVSSMEQASQESLKGLDVIQETGHSFQSIVTCVDQLSLQGTEITAATQEVFAASGEMEQAVQTTKERAQATLEAAQVISAATEEQSASMQQVSASSESLAQMSILLQENVQKFKV